MITESIAVASNAVQRFFLRRRYAKVKAKNDLVFRHAYACSAGVARLAGRGEKARLRFTLDALKTTDGWREEREIRSALL